MIDGHNTSPEWQAHAGDICVLPVGAFEQHGAHLPLDTDNIQAQYFAHRIAQELDAALLPPVCFATSLEHSGFRGTLSLRPETLMQILRDVADEVSRQGFRILLVVNYHGGNFALGPAMRDINRKDGPLKILMVQPWATIMDTGPEAAVFPDLHGGERETSVMMAIRPELVRATIEDRPAPAGEAIPLQQPDLNTFGVGQFNPRGIVGRPSLASGEKGQQYVAEMLERVMPYIRDRIARLRGNWHYAGRGGISLRRLLPADLAAAMRIKAQAGWNQTEADWALFMTAEPEGCFAAVCDGRTIGTVATIRYGASVAWLSMLLVDESFRSLGVGRQLFRRALEHLKGCPSIWLDATPAGKGIYTRMGFADVTGLHRWIAPSLPRVAARDRGVAVMSDADFAKVLEIDRVVFGADRGATLAALRVNGGDAALRLEKDGRLAAYCFGRKGSRFQQIGPVVASAPEDAIALVEHAAGGLAGSAVGLDVPDAQASFADWLREHGFAAERPLTRMVLGDASFKGLPQRQYAVAGPEFG